MIIIIDISTKYKIKNKNILLSNIKNNSKSKNKFNLDKYSSK